MSRRHESRARYPAWAVTLAVAVPLFVSSALAWALSRPIEDRLVVRSLALDERIRARDDWPVVVLGNSTASQALDPDVMSRVLRRPALRATNVQSTSVTWHATLKHWIYARGLEPELVLILAPLEVFWLRRPETGFEASVLDLVSTGQPIEDSRLRRMEIRRTLLRKEVSELASRTALGEELERSQRRDAGPFVVGVQRTMPLLAGAGNQLERTDLVYVDDLHDTHLPALAELVQQHGGRLVLAPTPTRPGAGFDAAEQADRQARLEELLSETGGAYLPMRGLRFPEGAFLDDTHLRKGRAAARYTEAVAQEVLKLERRSGR